MNILIVGASFGNKGAQSMLFTCVNEIKSRFDNATIWFLSYESIRDRKEYKFEYVHMDTYARHLEKGDLYYLPLALAKGIAKRVFGRKNELLEDTKLRRIIKSMDVIIDVSGFALSSDWGNDEPIEYFGNFDMAIRRKIPIVLMPQSFGPFDYGDNQMYMDSKAKQYMDYASVVFAREMSSYNSLKEKYEPRNLRYCPDLVLIGQFPERWTDIAFNDRKIEVPFLADGDYVGVVPNMRVFNDSNQKSIIDLYENIIRTVLDSGMNVCVFRHSSEDFEACEWIRTRVGKNKHIKFLDNDFTCLEYNIFCKQFKYIIASRYHSIIHAYRNGVPAIMLGWAEKYKELACLYKQDNYIFNIKNHSLDDRSEIIKAVKKMSVQYNDESMLIKKITDDIRKEYNCFDIIEEYIRGLRKRG